MKEKNERAQRNRDYVVDTSLLVGVVEFGSIVVITHLTCWEIKLLSLAKYLGSEAFRGTQRGARYFLSRAAPTMHNAVKISPVHKPGLRKK